MSESSGYTSKTARWLHYDRLGNVMNRSNESGALADTYYQDAYGNVLSSITTGRWASSFSGRHLTTKEYDSDAQLYYVWARWYDATIGLFLSKDPLVSYNGYQASGIAVIHPQTISTLSGCDNGRGVPVNCVPIQDATRDVRVVSRISLKIPIPVIRLLIFRSPERVRTRTVFTCRGPDGALAGSRYLTIVYV